MLNLLSLSAAIRVARRFVQDLSFGVLFFSFSRCQFLFWDFEAHLQIWLCVYMGYKSMVGSKGLFKKCIEGRETKRNRLVNMFFLSVLM